MNSVRSKILFFEEQNLMGIEQSYSVASSNSNMSKKYVSEHDIIAKISIGRKRSHSVYENCFNSKMETNLSRSISVGFQQREETHQNLQVNSDDPVSTPNGEVDDINDICNNSDIIEDTENAKHTQSNNLETESMQYIDESISSAYVETEEFHHPDAETYQQLSPILTLKSSSESNLTCEWIQTDGDNNTKHKSEEILVRNENSVDNRRNSVDDNYGERNSFTDREFLKIENSLREVERDILQMQNQTVAGYLSATNSVECINIYLAHQDYDKEEIIVNDEFGQMELGNYDQVDFVEAFNRIGDELIITTASIERKSILIDDGSENVLQSSSDSKYASQKSLVSENNTQSSGDESVSNNGNHGVSFELKDKSTSIDLQLDEPTNCVEHYSAIARDHSLGSTDKAVRAETIYDTFQNPRIEKVTNIYTTQITQSAALETIHNQEFTTKRVSKLNLSDLKTKIDYIIEELISSEKDYLNHLKMVVRSYMPALHSDKLPVFLRGSRYIFGNIKVIYKKSKKFYSALKKCGNDPDEIAKTFTIFEELFEQYPMYSKNKPTADYFLIGQLRELVLVKEKALNDRLGLSSHLLTPVQRLGKYILLLENMQKEIVKSEGIASGNVQRALTVVRKQMSRGNDYIAIDSIQSCPINLEAHAGSFIMRERFSVVKPKKFETMLFLFEHILVFTTVDNKNQELFIYKDSIRLSEMGIITFEDLPLSFHIKRFPSNKKGFSKEYQEFVIEARKARDKKIWTDEIEKRLWEQLVKCKEQQTALFSKHKRKSAGEATTNRIVNNKSGYRSFPEELKYTKRRSIFYDEEET